MQTLRGAISVPGRRLATTHGALARHHAPGVASRLSRVCAAETLGPSVDHLHEMRRRTLAQSLELDGGAPDGHPDNTPLISDPPAANQSISNAAASSSSSNGRLRISSSNGNGTTTSSIRRLRSSSSSSSSSSTRSGSSTSSSSVKSRGNGASAAATAAAAVHQQHDARTITQDVFPSSSSPSKSSSSSPSSATADTAAADTAAAAVAGSDSGEEQQQQQYDHEADMELQAEFRESRCCQDVLDIVADELNRFTPFHTVTALNRLAKLGKFLSWELRREVLADPSFMSLLDKLYQQSGSLNPFQLSTSLYSCAVLQVPLELRPGGTSSVSQLLPALEASITNQVREFNDRDVSSTLYAYAQLKMRKPARQQVIVLLCQQGQSLIDRRAMSGQSTSMALWSVATLHAVQQHGSSSSRALSSASGALVAAAARQLKSSEVSFDALGSQGVANSIWAAAKLGHHDQQLLQKGCEWMGKHLEQCKVQEVLNVLWAAGAGRYKPSLGTFTKHIASRPQVLKPADIASLFHVLGIFGFEFSTNPELLTVLLSRAQQLLPQMKPSEATSLYWGLGMTRQVDSQLFQQLTNVVAQLQQQQAAAQQQLEQLGLAAGSSRPGKQQQQRLQQGFQQQQQQAGVVQQHHSMDSRQLQQLQDRARQFPDSLKRQAFQAYIAAKLEAVPLELPAPVLDAFRAAWLSGNRSSGSRQQQQPLLDDLAWLLQQLAIKARVKARSKLDRLMVVDVELKGSGGRMVALQLLDVHNTDSDGVRLAPVHWEEDVLRRNDYDVVFGCAWRTTSAARRRHGRATLRTFCGSWV